MDFDWTDAGSPEDHAERIETLGNALMDKGLYKSSNDLYIAAQCIRYLSAKAEVLEKENDAAEKEIEALREAARTGAAWMQWWIDQADCECDGVHVCGKRERERELQTIRQALAAHDRGEK